MKHFNRVFTAFAVLAALVIFFVGRPALADHFGDDGRTFLENVRDAGEAEDTAIIEHTKTSPAVADRLGEIAFYQAQIWADTILEGDYYAENEIQVDQIEGVYRGRGELVAYRVTYSAKAWMTAECEYDHENPETLKGCLEGRIVESTFVSPAMASWTRDDDAMAEFQE